MFDSHEAERLMRHAFCECCDDHNGFKCTRCAVQEVLAMIESEDNVIRCKRCVHAAEAVINDNGFMVCPASGMEITTEDYCSYAERA